MDTKTNASISLREKLWTLKVECPSIPKSSQAVIRTKAGGTFKYNYAKLDKIDEILVPLCKRLRIKFNWRIDFVVVGETIINVLYTRVECADTGDFIESKLALCEYDIDFQEEGKRMTYLQRYCLMQLLGLVADEDDDGESSRERGGRGSRSRAGKRSRPTDDLPEDDEDDDDTYEDDENDDIDPDDEDDDADDEGEHEAPRGKTRRGGLPMRQNRRRGTARRGR